MKKSVILSVLTLALVGALATVPAFAGDIVLYDDTVNGVSFVTDSSLAYYNSDSFVLSQNSTVTGATLGLWLRSGDTASTVSWEIDSSPYPGTLLYSGSSGVLTATPEPPLSWDHYYDIYDVAIALPDLSLSAGTYYLQLDNFTTGLGGTVWWDVSNGPSIAYGGEGDTPSETFQILGEEGSVIPEPSSFLLLGSGLAGLAGMLRRRFV